jgi:transcriptional regulator with XRE-family HTH domain
VITSGGDLLACTLSQNEQARKQDFSAPISFVTVTHRPSLGDIIRRQRELRRLTLRTLAELTGISNPYLSQIERGLRAPSEQVVSAIARTLELNADELYDLAGIQVEDESASSRVPEAIQADPALTPRQRRALLGVYESLVDANPDHRQRKRRARAGGA